GWPSWWCSEVHRAYLTSARNSGTKRSLLEQCALRALEQVLRLRRAYARELRQRLHAVIQGDEHVSRVEGGGPDDQGVVVHDAPSRLRLAREALFHLGACPDRHLLGRLVGEGHVLDRLHDRELRRGAVAREHLQDDERWHQHPALAQRALPERAAVC